MAPHPKRFSLTLYDLPQTTTSWANPHGWFSSPPGGSCSQGARESTRVLQFHTEFSPKSAETLRYTVNILYPIFNSTTLWVFRLQFRLGERLR